MLFYAVSDAACHSAQGGCDNHLQNSADKRGWDFYVLVGRTGADWALAVPMIRPAERGGRPHIHQRAAPLARASSATRQNDIQLHI